MLFRSLRFLTTTGKEFLPSQGTFRPIVPELIELDRLLEQWRISREQLVDLAILVGTDFNDGVKGIGPKKALKLVQQYGRLEAMPEYLSHVGDLKAVRGIFLEPDVTDDYQISFGQPDFAGIRSFLCQEREFAEDRVSAALGRAFREPTLF